MNKQHTNESVSSLLKKLGCDDAVVEHQKLSVGDLCYDTSIAPKGSETIFEGGMVRKQGTIVRPKERVKKNGEIFTPPKLVKEMVDKVVECSGEAFKDHTNTFIDPAAGDGAFLTHIIDRKLKSGSPPEAALATTFGVELMPDNSALLRRNLLHVVEEHGYQVTQEMKDIVKRNIVTGDFLEWDFERWKQKKPELMYHEKPVKRARKPKVKINCLDGLLEW